MVTCALHNKKRMAKYCDSRAVRDADGNVVGLHFTCNVNSPCTTGGVGGGPHDASAFVALANARGLHVPYVADTATSPTPPPQQPFVPAVRQPVRYYDLTRQGGNDAAAKKVCFLCGLESHEKPDCPNQFCRRCHQLLRYGHCCPPLQPPSPFATLDKIPKEQLRNVRCPVCHEDGHLDCLVVRAPDAKWCPSCAYCGKEGHHAFDCPEKPLDHWERRIDETMGRAKRSRSPSDDEAMGGADRYRRKPNPRRDAVQYDGSRDYRGERYVRGGREFAMEGERQGRYSYGGRGDHHEYDNRPMYGRRDRYPHDHGRQSFTYSDVIQF